jgi:O-antigen ligase
MLAIGLIIGFGILLQAERTFGSWVAPLMIPLVATGICVSTLLSGRSLQYASFDLNLQSAGVGAGGGWLLRGLTVALLALSGAVIFSRWFKRQQALPAWSTQLFVAFAAFFVCNSLLNSAFGSEPVFIHNLFYPIVLFAAAYVTSRTSLPLIISTAKLTLIVLMVLSVVLAVVKPDMAIQPNYRGWIPGLNSRLWGIGSSANSIGPLALVLLLCEYIQPYKRWWLRWPVVGLAMAVFIYAQSKTVFAAAAGLLLILAWYRVGKSGKGIDIRFAIALILLGCGLLGTLLSLDVGRMWDRLQLTQAGNDIATLTGRWQIWGVAVNEWLKNPLFGYGPEIWGPEYRQRIGMQFAFSAGALGVISLIAYVALLARGAFAMATETKGVSVALFGVLLVRCVTEAPLTLATMFNGDFITHLLMFHLAVRAVPTRASAVTPRVQPPNLVHG